MSSDKDETEVELIKEDQAIKGDAIGSTAYSERFVLKLLLKFADLNTLRGQLEEQSFEEDLCTLWDMSADKDVVEFLHEHKTLSLLHFALPAVESNRITEIMLGMLGNMCCSKTVVGALFEMDEFLSLVMEHMTSTDTRVLKQVLRIVNVCLYSAEGDNIHKWLDIFHKIDYLKSMDYILQNSANKELLICALETLNTVCARCNVELSKEKFFAQFVNPELVKGIYVVFMELAEKQKRDLDKEELMRVFAITLQIVSHLISFEASLEVLRSVDKDITKIVVVVLDHFENILVNTRQIVEDFIEIYETIAIIVKKWNMGKEKRPQVFFDQSYNIWIVTNYILNEENRSLNDIDTIEVSHKLQLPLSNLICYYLDNCSSDNFFDCLHKLDRKYDLITNTCDDKEAVERIHERLRALLKMPDDDSDQSD